jgi:hypothetical protein
MQRQLIGGPSGYPTPSPQNNINPPPNASNLPLNSQLSTIQDSIPRPYMASQLNLNPQTDPYRQGAYQSSNLNSIPNGPSQRPDPATTN